jgi:hypothetical protein
MDASLAILFSTSQAFARTATQWPIAATNLPRAVTKPSGMIRACDKINHSGPQLDSEFTVSADNR